MVEKRMGIGDLTGLEVDRQPKVIDMVEKKPRFNLVEARYCYSEIILFGIRNHAATVNYVS